MAKLRIGLLVDDLLKQQYLSAMIAQAGHNLGFRGLVTLDCQELPAINDAIDAWIIDTADDSGVNLELVSRNDPNSLAGDQTRETALDYLLEHASVPILLNDSSEYRPGSAEHSAWLRRMAQRLQRLCGDINLQQVERAPSLWILAASTGGPAAVKEFLSQLPAELGIAFIYVQHIDTNYTPTLIKMMSSAGAYPAVLACDGQVLQSNTLTLFTAERRVDVLENGTLAVTQESWGGRYAPSIDQVVANVARTYRHACGLIIFTGMGDDGTAGSRLIKQQGGHVWVQSPESCASPSMPEAALAAECVNFTGTPNQLAQHLSQQMMRTHSTHIATTSSNKIRTALP